MRRRSSTSSEGPTPRPLLVGVVAPFTGADAALGPAYFAACLPAARAINSAGGVMGHQVSCQQFDTRGEPADAVPAANQMLASHSNLMAVVGCTSDEASSVVPIIDHAHIPMFCMTGQSEFNKSSFTYFHRLVPPDEFDAYAIVGSALDFNHYKKVAMVFGNDIGSQAFVKPAMTALQHLGATVTINQAIALGQSSYRTEVTAMLATHPDVIFTEALGPTDATYLAEVKQLNGSTCSRSSGHLGDDRPRLVQGGLGRDRHPRHAQVLPGGGPRCQLQRTRLHRVQDQPRRLGVAVRRRAEVLAAGSTLHLYDGIIQAALAMDATKSTDPTVYNPKIKDIGNGVSGAVDVHTYKDGVAALASGKSIRWVGAGGTTQYNQYNNSQQGYILVKYDAQGNEVTIGTLTTAQTAAVIAAGGG